MKHLRGDLAYEFSIHKLVMWLVGTWPLDSKHYIFNIRWLLGMIAEMSVTIPAILEVLRPRSEYGSKLDILIVMLICLLSLLKNLLFRLRSAKLENNVVAASIDWSLPRDKESYILMRKHAKLGRVVSVALIISGYACFASFLVSIIIFPWTSSRTSKKIIRHYLLPYGPLESVTDWEYRCHVLIQFLQACVIHARQCVVDSFFFCITMHLCGQFDILKIEFLNFHGELCTDTQYRRGLGALVRRHCELIGLVKNIEHTFHLIVLIQAMMNVFLLGTTGLQLVVALKKRAFHAVAKCITFITFFILQTVMYAHAGQTLLEESRNVLQAMYDTKWQGLRPIRSKDFILIMIRSNVPFYISGGKFFYMCYYAVYGMVKRAFTYVTFLQLTMTDID